MVVGWVPINLPVAFASCKLELDWNLELNWLKIAAATVVAALAAPTLPAALPAAPFAAAALYTPGHIQVPAATAGIDVAAFTNYLETAWNLSCAGR